MARLVEIVPARLPFGVHFPQVEGIDGARKRAVGLGLQVRLREGKPMRHAPTTCVRFFVFIFVLAVAVFVPANAVIYGSDDRTEVFDWAEHPEWSPVFASSAALVLSGDIDTSDPTNVTFLAPTLGEYLDLCPGERFTDQSTAAFCSGTLIDDDLILTAGHCIETSSDCEDTLFVFNYFMAAEHVPGTVTTDEIYECAEIVDRVYVGSDDFAIVRLDRPAEGIPPAPVRRGGMFEHRPGGGGVVAIGHPYGIPLKIADNASAWEGSADHFHANTDSFAGNSGSGVCDAATSELVGILVRGNDDWVYNGTCYESAWCDDTGCVPPVGEGFEEAVRSNFLAPWAAARCGDGLCDPGEDEFSCPDDCPQDSDYDLQPDFVDNCPFVPNPLQENSDGDPRGDACDCDPGNSEFWDTPSEVSFLSVLHDQVTGWTQLTWDPPLDPGSTSVVYDTLRSDLPNDFTGAALCLESDDGVDLTAEDWAGDPPVGAVVYYLVRAENACPLVGTGPAGTDSRRRPREARACP
jgi:hypothetical protein